MKIDNPSAPIRARCGCSWPKRNHVPMRDVDLMAAENRRPPYTDRNPGGQLPGTRTRQRQDHRRDRRHLRVPGREESQAPARRSDGRGAGRDAPVAAPRRAEYHGKHLQRVSLCRGLRPVQKPHAGFSRGCALTQDARAEADGMARRADRGSRLDRAQPFHRRRYYPLLLYRFFLRRGPANPGLGQKPPGVVQARGGPAEREREPASCVRSTQDARIRICDAGRVSRLALGAADRRHACSQSSLWLCPK